MSFETKKNIITDKIVSLDTKLKFDEDKPFPLNGHIIAIFSGRRGSGKSTLILNILKHVFKKHYDLIILFSPTATRDPKFSKLIKELDHDNQYFTSVDEESIHAVIDLIRNNNDKILEEEKREPYNLILFDDCIHDLKKNNPAFNELITTNRHLKTDIWIATQKYNTYLSTLVRSNADIICTFRSDVKSEIDTLKHDLNINEKLFDDLYNFATKEPNSFFMINFLTGKPIFYKRFDKIIL
jgi:archaellum biogenesis ATPase FlaH